MANELTMGDNEEQPVKKRGKRFLFIVLFVILLLGGIGAGLYFFVFDKKIPFLEPPATNATEQNNALLNAPSGPIGNIVPMPQFRVNLADPLGRRILQINIAVEVVNPGVIEELKTLDAKVRDAIIILLSSKTYADIATPDSKLVLKSELTSRINQVIGGNKVLQTFITSLLIN